MFINKFFFKIFLNLIPFLNKILFAQFFLNSEDSGTLILKKDNGKFNLSVGKVQKKSEKIINNLINKINNEKNIKIKMSKFFLKKFYVGESYHWGSSFKMQKNNNIYSTDIFGKPYGFKKVSIIDSTVLPTLPSNSHSYLTMCNAYRITDAIMNKNF